MRNHTSLERGARRAATLTVAVVFLSAGCDRSPAPTDNGPSPSAIASSPSSSVVVAQPASSARDSGVGFSGGHASSGPGHETVSIESKDGPKGADFGALSGRLGACYKASPHRAANEAVRVSLEMAVNPTEGAVATSATTTIGVLGDKGNGAKGYVFATEPPKKDDALLKCIDDVTKTTTVNVPHTNRGTTFSVTIEVSP